MESRLINEERMQVVYASKTLQWAFVKKNGKDYELLHDFLSCKDYIHEIISNSIHSKKVTTSLYAPLLELSKDKLQIALLFKCADNEAAKLKKVLYSAKKLFSDLEIEAKLPKTLIKEVSCNKINTKVFIITVKRHHIDSPVLLHSLLALLRTVAINRDVVTKDNIITVLEDKRSKDWEILRYLFKNNILNILLNKHKEMFENVDLTAIYPPEVIDTVNTTYHSGFGPVALKNKRLYSQFYAEKLYQLMDTIKIK